MTYFTVEGEAQQIPVYQRCISVSGLEFSWIAAIDIDEFIVIEDDAARDKPHAKQLKAVLEEFRFQPGADFTPLLVACACKVTTSAQGPNVAVLSEISLP